MAIFLGLGASAARAGEVFPHRSLWPDGIGSAAEFDRASRAEILVFAHVLADSEALSDSALKNQLGVDAIDVPSIERVRRELWKRLTGNYGIAAAGCTASDVFCPADPASRNLQHEAAALSDAGVQPRYRPWFDDAVQFHRSYLDELLRLAARFPAANSEIETLNDNEFAGWELQDRHFLLSFDDGPTPAPAGQGSRAGDTDLTLAMLRSHQVNAVFFAIGELFEARLRASSNEAMKTLYGGMCVGSHGWLHKSHQTWPQWQDSVEASSKLIHDTLPDSYVPAFRPPYGQRLPGSGPYFVDRGLKVMLWNIDSHDWDNGLTAENVEQRVMSLMLLWRRGLILFHDFFPRSRVVVPRLIAWLAHDDVVWVDCHEINWPAGYRPAKLSPVTR